MYTQRLITIESWASDSASKQFFQYNSVKSVKFGTNFVSILQFDGTLYSNIEGGDLKTIAQGVKEIDCCMFGMILVKYNNEIIWYKLHVGELLNAGYDGNDVTVVAASVYGIIGRKDGKVIAFDVDYQREINFIEKNTCCIKDIKATPKMLLILTEEMNIYSCGLITFEARMLNANPIRLIAVGNTHSLALIQAEIAPLSQWSTETLMEFKSENGFEECCQLIRYHEIDGTDLEDLNDKYFLETLGIRETDRRSKLKYLLKKANCQGFSKKYDIIGWGRNQYMQLGPEGHMINSPIKLTRPELGEDEKIISLHCDKNFSYILTSNSKLLALGGKSNVKMTKNDKKGIIWDEIQQKLLEKGKIVKVETSNKMIGIIYRREIKTKINIKMRMAEDILRMIENGRMPTDSYEIGYLDRFLGILETSLEAFGKSDIRKHRIQYFKRNGKIVWDRRTKTDIF